MVTSAGVGSRKVGRPRRGGGAGDGERRLRQPMEGDRRPARLTIAAIMRDVGNKLDPRREARVTERVIRVLSPLSCLIDTLARRARQNLKTYCARSGSLALARSPPVRPGRGHDRDAGGCQLGPSRGPSPPPSPSPSRRRLKPCWRLALAWH